MSNDTEKQKQPLAANKARQGEGGRRIVLFMVIFFILAALVWWGVEFYGESIAPSQVAPDQQIGGPAG